MAALFAAASDSPSQQIWLLYAAMALCQGLVAVPVWLAGRELGLGRWSAVVAAAIAAGGSFAIYGVSNLNQSVGLLCATVMLWAMVRALRRPGLASDVLVCPGVAATALARLGWAPLVVAFVPGALAAAWLERPSGERPGGWLRALPFRLVRRHPVLAPLFVLGIIVAIVSGPSTLVGGENYGGVALNARLEAATPWDNARRDFSLLAIGVALVPFTLAIPVLVRDLARPADATSGGFAWLVLGLLVAFSYIHYTAVAEDRYLASSRHRSLSPVWLRSFVDRRARVGRAGQRSAHGSSRNHLAWLASPGRIRLLHRTDLRVLRARDRRPTAGERPNDRATHRPRRRACRRSGEVDMTGPVPGVVVDNPGTSRVGFSGTPLDGSRHFPFAALQRLRRPLRTLWIVRGDSVQGYPNRGQPLRLRVFPPTARGTCVRGFVAVHPAADRPSRYRLDRALNGPQGVARPGELVRFTARVPGGPPTTLVLRGGGGRLPDGSRLGPSLFYLSVAECR
jgi:hypothetical protein